MALVEGTNTVISRAETLPSGGRASSVNLASISKVMKSGSLEWACGSSDWPLEASSNGGMASTGMEASSFKVGEVGSAGVVLTTSWEISFYTFKASDTSWLYSVSISIAVGDGGRATSPAGTPFPSFPVGGCLVTIFKVVRIKSVHVNHEVILT